MPLIATKENAIIAIKEIAIIATKENAKCHNCHGPLDRGMGECFFRALAATEISFFYFRKNSILVIDISFIRKKKFTSPG
jgi:hypothetical protein